MSAPAATAGGPPCRTAQFRASPDRPLQLRRITAAYLRYWGLDQLAESAADRAAALLAGTGAGTLRVELHHGELSLSVQRAEGT